MANPLQPDLFTSIISEIKAYTGNDPLLPWLRGVKKMRDSLSPRLLAEKMPRFLQKCAQTFESDRRYRNDLRFIRVWLELMDFVDDPKAILRNMEKNRIGIKRSLFYQAYALYYEKMKKFDEAEQIYRVGVQNLAEPLDDLQKSYEKFLYRMEHHKSKMMQRLQKRSSRRPLSDRSSAEQSSEDSSKLDTRAAFSSHEGSLSIKENDVAVTASQKLLNQPFKEEVLLDASDCKSGFEIQNACDASKNDRTNKCISVDKVKQPGKPRNLQREDTVITKFVDTAIVGGSEAEDACHHGLVDPTINMKEAMNAINNMFREPLELAVATRRQCKSQPDISQKDSGFEVFIDDTSENGIRSSDQEDGQSKRQQPVQQTFQIYADDDEDSSEFQSSAEKSPSCSQEDGFPFLRPDDQQSESSSDANMEKASKTRFREDTVVHRFVGSTILDDEAEVENICHHGLVDPTVNLKQAMDDINGMFGKPIDFVRMTRKKKLAATASLKKGFSEFSILPDDDVVIYQGQNPASLKDHNGFSILPDDDLVYNEGQNPAPLKNYSEFTILPDDDLPVSSSGNGKGSHDLYEETVFTKQAMDDINKISVANANRSNGGSSRFEETIYGGAHITEVSTSNGSHKRTKESTTISHQNKSDTNQYFLWRAVFRAESQRTSCINHCLIIQQQFLIIRWQSTNYRSEYTYWKSFKEQKIQQQFHIKTNLIQISTPLEGSVQSGKPKDQLNKSLPHNPSQPSSYLRIGKRLH
ncbi:hypothetical protein V2J09_024184 [Rumex salicifolius]